MREDGIGADQLVLAGDQRPSRGEVVVIFAIDDRIGTGFAELGFFTTGSTPQAYLDRVKSETERWTRVVKENNIKVEG